MTKFLEQELVEQVLKLPSAPAIVAEIETQLAAERAARLQFYNDITEQEKAEFINGEVIIHSPVMKFHNDISGNVYTMLRTFVTENNLGFIGIEKILVQFSRNDYEPDICYFNAEQAAQFRDDQSLFPVPNLIVEVLSKGTAPRDRGVKFQDYESHSVQEYWIIAPQSRTVEQYLNGPDGFELHLKSTSGDISSPTINGLTLPIAAIFDTQRARALVKQILLDNH
ncbi:MAG: Uma2 family endonuclease [Bacteroidota bacterium]